MQTLQDRLCCYLMLSVIKLAKSTSKENVACLSLVFDIEGKLYIHSSQRAIVNPTYKMVEQLLFYTNEVNNAQ
jgi:hypothetical protein